MHLTKENQGINKLLLKFYTISFDLINYLKHILLVFLFDTRGKSLNASFLLFVFGEMFISMLALIF